MAEPDGDILTLDEVAAYLKAGKPPRSSSTTTPPPSPAWNPSKAAR